MTGRFLDCISVCMCMCVTVDSRQYIKVLFSVLQLHGKIVKTLPPTPVHAGGKVLSRI